MKLLDESGKFTFIKNSEVAIDTSLPKYQRLEEFRKKPGEDQSNGDKCQGVSIEKTIDAKLREKIGELGNTALSEYLGTWDAFEFNKRFAEYLLSEVDINKYSVSVIESHLIPYSGEVYRQSEPRFLDRLKKAISILFPGSKSLKAASDKREVLSVIEFFSTIHVKLGQEKRFIEKLQGLFELLEDAKKMGQTAQEDKICQMMILDVYESVLSMHGLEKYLEFTDLERLSESGKKCIDIDYVENFGRVIPKSVIEKKVWVDSLGIFDNYCIMYYDPSGNTYKKKEAAMRDPILFGLINHSSRLYYISDWEDDLCNLTLDKIAEDLSIKKLER